MDTAICYSSGSHICLIINAIRYKIRNKNLEMKRSVERIASISTIVEPKKNFKVIEADPEDDNFFDCAIEGNAEFIISQDNHLLRQKEFGGIPIV